MNANIDTKTLLDKLYNLKNSDSVILKKIEEESEKANSIKTKSENECLELRASIEKISEEIITLNEEGQALKEILSSINKNSFNVVLDKLEMDFNPEDLHSKISTKLPNIIDNLKHEKESLSYNLKESETTLNDSVTQIDELSFKKDDALSNQSKLVEYMDLALKGNINITRGALTDLFANFNLTNDEAILASKILMFPEDALYDYDKAFKEGKVSGKSFSDVFAGAKNNNIIDIEEEKEEYTIEENTLVNPILTDFDAEEIVIKEEPVKEEKTEEINPIDIKELLEKNEFKYSDFTTNDITFIQSHLNETLLTKNVKLMKDLGINNDIFIDNIELLIDDELDVKVNSLLAAGKVPFDIYLNPSILVKYDFEELNKAINALKESGLDPKKVPLMAY